MVYIIIYLLVYLIIYPTTSLTEYLIIYLITYSAVSVIPKPSDIRSTKFNITNANKQQRSKRWRQREKHGRKNKVTDKKEKRQIDTLTNERKEG